MLLLQSYCFFIEFMKSLTSYPWCLQRVLLFKKHTPLQLIEVREDTRSLLFFPKLFFANLYPIVLSSASKKSPQRLGMFA